MNFRSIGETEIENRFTYHAPNGDQLQRYQEIRDQARRFAILLDASCPPSREFDKAIAHLEMAVMWGNAAIARHG